MHLEKSNKQAVRAILHKMCVLAPDGNIWAIDQNKSKSINMLKAYMNMMQSHLFIEIFKNYRKTIKVLMMIRKNV